MTDTEKSKTKSSDKNKSGLLGKFKKGSPRKPAGGVLSSLREAHEQVAAIDRTLNDLCCKFDGKLPEEPLPIEDDSVMTHCADIERRLIVCLNMFRDFQNQALTQDNSACDITTDKSSCFEQYVDSMIFLAHTLEREIKRSRQVFFPSGKECCNTDEPDGLIEKILSLPVILDSASDALADLNECI